jgi:hypothetical protein
MPKPPAAPLLAQVQAWPHDRPFTVTDFPGATPAQVRQAARARVAEGTVWACAPDVWVHTRHSRWFPEPIPPGVAQIAEAVARRTGERLGWTPAEALNALRFSTQCVVKEIRTTSGRSRDIPLFPADPAGRTGVLTLRHVPAWQVAPDHPGVRLALAALVGVGRTRITAATFAHLQRTLPPDLWTALLAQVDAVPRWLAGPLRAYRDQPQPQLRRPVDETGH